MKSIAELRQNVKFKKQLAKAPARIQRTLQQRLALFLKDQFHPLLHNHQLVGSYSKYRSINITGDWRALYKEVAIDEKHVIIEFHLFGTHSQLYR